MSREITADSNLILSAVEAQSANRWYHEQQRLRAFPAFAFLSRNGHITAVEGALDTQNGNTYGIRIEVTNFPYALPEVFPKGWTPYPGVTHAFPDGSLCIMRTRQWRTHFTVALVVAKTAIWLAKYEIWKRNGHHWPGLEQRH